MTQDSQQRHRYCGLSIPNQSNFVEICQIWISLQRCSERGRRCTSLSEIWTKLSRRYCVWIVSRRSKLICALKTRAYYNDAMIEVSFLSKSWKNQDLKKKKIQNHAHARTHNRVSVLTSCMRRFSIKPVIVSVIPTGCRWGRGDMLLTAPNGSALAPLVHCVHKVMMMYRAKRSN